MPIIILNPESMNPLFCSQSLTPAIDPDDAAMCPSRKSLISTADFTNFLDTTNYICYERITVKKYSGNDDLKDHPRCCYDKTKTSM